LCFSPSLFLLNLKNNVPSRAGDFGVMRRLGELFFSTNFPGVQSGESAIS